MLKNHIKIALRYLLKHKGYSLLNIGGLALGMTVAVLISLWIWDEASFNRYHQNYDRIAAVLQNQTFNGKVETGWSQAMQLAPELRSNYGNHFKYVSMANWTMDHSLLYNGKAMFKKGIFMESVAPEMLSLKMLEGSRSGLTDPHSILLSAATAKSIFGDERPLDKTLILSNDLEVQVTGVYEDLPSNTNFGDIEFIAPWKLYTRGLPEWLGWGNNWFQTFVQVADGADMAQVSEIIKDAKLKNSGDDARFHPEIFLHPMSKWHLYSEFKDGTNTGGSIQYVWLFGIIGVFVLLLACINFMNLSTARSEKRAKEVGVRKAIGSGRNRLVGQFFGESLLVAFLAFFVSLLSVVLLLPYFNEVAGKEIRIYWEQPLFWLGAIGFTVFTGLVAGSYPALYLSSFRPIKVLKGTFRSGPYAAVPRKALVVVQFTISVILIIGTIVVFQQIQFAKNRPIGYSTNNLLTIPIKSDEIHKHYEAFRLDLMQSGVVTEVAKSESPVTQTWTTNSGLDWRGKDPDMQDEFATVRVSHEFGKTVNWEIKQGRDFSRDFATDSTGLVINEAAVEYMGFEKPIGETIKWGDSGNYQVIGVVKNMITQSPYTPVKQTIFFIDYDRSDILTLKIDKHTAASQAITTIESVFKKYDPVNPIDYQFADQDYASKFAIEVRVGKLASIFAMLAIFISCLGLFGMASYVAEQRTKEIGIRKVLGASVSNLWRMLSRDFVLLVLLSCLIATPIAYYFLNEWLQQYEYRTEISYLVFAAAGLSALLITLLTVSYQAITAAVANPVTALRSE